MYVAVDFHGGNTPDIEDALVLFLDGMSRPSRKWPVSVLKPSARIMIMSMGMMSLALTLAMSKHSMVQEKQWLSGEQAETILTKS